MKAYRFKYIGIDPGVSGGITVINEAGRIKTFKCPKTVSDMSILFQICYKQNNVTFIRNFLESSKKLFSVALSVSQ